MRNLNLLFNKLYYRRLGHPDFEDSLKENNRLLFDATFDHVRDYVKLEAATHIAVMKTLYPGLLVGRGNVHISTFAQQDIDNGFSFDHVSGQPYIPGCLVKGTLRGHFRDRPAVIAEILADPVLDVAALEAEIFDGADVFFDTVVYDGNDQGRLLGREYVTRHGSLTHHPNPVTMLKILPEVRLEFRFALTDGTLTADEKLTLFKTLLELFGVGARTAAGYGYLRETGTTIVDKALSERIVCPHSRCHVSNYKFYPNGALRMKCYRCKKPLYPESGDETDESTDNAL